MLERGIFFSTSFSNYALHSYPAVCLYLSKEPAARNERECEYAKAWSCISRPAAQQGEASSRGDAANRVTLLPALES